MDVTWGHVLAIAVVGVKVVIIITLVQVLRGLWWLVNMLFIQPPSDPLRHLPGPDGKKMENHFRYVMDPDRTPETHEEWVKTYGKTFRFHGFGSFDYRLMSLDLRAVSHVLNSPIYEKPWQTRRLLTRLLGRGVFAMEGEEHRFQRKVLGPAFTTQATKAMSPIMFQKAEELKERWDIIIASPPSQSAPQTASTSEKLCSDEATIDVAHWISRATFDIIGLAGFDYAFHSLQDESEEVYMAYRTMFNAADKGPQFKRIAELFFPIIEKLFPDEGLKKVNASLATIKRRGEELVRSKKQAILAEIRDAKDITEKDILSLLIKANLSENPAHRLSDAELLDQLSTFLFAGSDTTAIAIAWALHYLAHDRLLQSALRVELASLAPSTPSSVSSSFSTSSSSDYVTALDALPLLDAVVKETLRLAPPVHGTIRVATQDDYVPLSEPVVLRTNEVVSAVRVRKGSYVHIPIEGLNYSKNLWGEDALVFRPSRWLSSTSTSSSSSFTTLPPPSPTTPATPTSPTAAPGPHPGLANVMSFSFGPHACIGWRFSLLEMKAFLSVLLPQFVFAPDAPISKYNAIITRPYITDKYELGTQLPLKVSKCTA